MSEPRYGFKRVVKSGRNSKVKGFFTLLMGTEFAGTIEIPGFKVVEGSNGPFISLPNRRVPVPGRPILDGSGAETGREAETVKYYNNIRFENAEKYKEFRSDIEKEVLPGVLAKLQ